MKMGKLQFTAMHNIVVINYLICLRIQITDKLFNFSFFFTSCRILLKSTSKKAETFEFSKLEEIRAGLNFLTVKIIE